MKIILFSFFCMNFYTFCKKIIIQYIITRSKEILIKFFYNNCNHSIVTLVYILSPQHTRACVRACVCVCLSEYNVLFHLTPKSIGL